MLSCAKQKHFDILYIYIYTLLLCFFETRLNLNIGCLFVVLDLLDSVVWSLFNRISFLGHVLI